MAGALGIAPAIACTFSDEAERSQEDVDAPSSHLPTSDKFERQLTRRSSFRTSRSVSTGKVASGLPPIPIPDSDDEGAPVGW